MPCINRDIRISRYITRCTRRKSPLEEGAGSTSNARILMCGLCSLYLNKQPSPCQQPHKGHNTQQLFCRLPLPVETGVLRLTTFGVAPPLLRPKQEILFRVAITSPHGPPRPPPSRAHTLSPASAPACAVAVGGAATAGGRAGAAHVRVRNRCDDKFPERVGLVSCNERGIAGGGGGGGFSLPPRRCVSHATGTETLGGRGGEGLGGVEKPQR